MGQRRANDNQRANNGPGNSGENRPTGTNVNASSFEPSSMKSRYSSGNPSNVENGNGVSTAVSRNQGLNW